MTRTAPRAGVATLLATAMSLAVGGSVSAQEYEWPRLLVIGTAGTSSGSFASTNGWAPILQKKKGAVVRVAAEHKYDGQRAQVHRLADGSVRLFSRKLDDMTHKYPDVVQRVARGV